MSFDYHTNFSSSYSITSHDVHKVDTFLHELKHCSNVEHNAEYEKTKQKTKPKLILWI